MRDELTAFVREALDKGLARTQIEAVLLQAGWSADQIRSGLAAFASIEFPVPVPRPRPSLSAREAFTYVVLFTSLYIVTINVGSLLFVFINLAFPDAAALETRASVRSGMRFATAALIVAGPVFLYVSSVTNREVGRLASARLSPVRRWLTYLTLFVATSVLMGDVTALVYNLLGGELTMRFGLKVLVVGAIAGAVLWYYLCELRADELVGRR